MNLQTLHTEILAMITESLDNILDVYRLSSVSHFFHELVNPILHRRMVLDKKAHAFIRAVEKGCENVVMSAIRSASAHPKWSWDFIPDARVSTKHQALVRILLAREWNVDMMQETGRFNFWGVVHMAVLHREPIGLRLILETYGSFQVNPPSGKYRNLLHHAIHPDGLPIVELLLQYQFPVDDVSSRPWRDTPLMVAASLGLAEIVQRLLEANSSVYMTDRAGRSPLIHAVDSAWLPRDDISDALDLDSVITSLVRGGAALNADYSSLARQPGGNILDYAVETRAHTAIGVLLNAGARYPCPRNCRRLLDDVHLARNSVLDKYLYNEHPTVRRRARDWKRQLGGLISTYAP